MPLYIKIYIFIFRVLRSTLKPLGLLSFLENSHTVLARYIRSLFAVYDINDLIHLDLAWWNFSVMHAVENFLNSRTSPSVFEYGSGASTFWLASRASHITSVEYNAEFYRELKHKLAHHPHVKLLLCEATTSKNSGSITSQKKGFKHLNFNDFVHKIDKNNNAYDLIIIDGRCREACLPLALNHLKPNGIILFDDTQRGRYLSAITHTPDICHKSIKGLTPSLPTRNQSTFIAKDQHVIDTLDTNPKP